MGKFGYMGSNWLKGPYYPKSGLGKYLTPMSRLGKVGTVGAAISSFRVGWKIGRHLDNRFGLSDRISDHWSSRTPRSVKWWIHRNF